MPPIFMSQNKCQKTSSIALVTLAIIVANLTSPGLTRADIFSGSSSRNNSNSIFGNFTNRISNIFQGRSVQLGGSVVPYEPNIPAPPGPNDPPLPDGGNFLKVWVEWETMYKNMTVPPGPEEQDPLQPIHEEYIKGNAALGEPPHGCCAGCGEVVVEDSISPALWGWCGGTAQVDGNDIPTPDGAISSVQTDSAGPNDLLLPAAIPNKLIRRDGYVYKCLKTACYSLTATPSPGPTPPGPQPTLPEVWFDEERWNYMEFQTMIYHSNDFEYDVCVQNVGDEPITDISIYRHSREDNEWPHNISLGENPVSSINTVLGAPYLPMEYHHGDTYPAQMEPAGDLEPGETHCFLQHHDHFDLARDRILSVPATFPKVGYNSPRDYNFVCWPGDGEGERCSGRKLLLDRSLTDEEYYKYFFEVRDVSAIGGCGYNASSNNSIIGPITYEVLYGGESNQDRASRSVVTMSIPVGNPLDDEAHPFGWPATGVIKEDWGNTGIAQAGGAYRNLQSGGRTEYDEYLYCPGEGDTYPIDGRPRAGDYLHPGIDIGPPATSAQPSNVYTTHAGYVTFAGYDPAYPDKGYTVQLETDFNRDLIPDALTRYSHLLPGSIQLEIDSRDRASTFSSNGTRWEYGTSLYVPRGALIGKMGDTGSPGDRHTQYEIMTIDPSDPNALPINGDIGSERCIDNPYSLGCWVTDLESEFFSKLRFAPNLVVGPVYVNPT